MLKKYENIKMTKFYTWNQLKCDKYHICKMHCTVKIKKCPNAKYCHGLCASSN